METVRKFRFKGFDSKNLKIIIGLLSLFIVLIVFAMLRDTDKLITHKQANALYNKEKIKKLIVDGEYIRIKTDEGQYKVYKDAINKNAFFSKYPVEVKEEPSHLYDLFSLLVLVGAFIFLFRFMKESRMQQIRQIGTTGK